MTGTSSANAENYRFYFGIPLRAKACSQNWKLVCKNLEQTLLSLSRQSCLNFKVLIACHERPDVDSFGLDVEFVISDMPHPDVDAVNQKGEPVSDKPTKKRLLGMALSQQAHQSFYYMHLDADDLVHPDLVAITLADDNKQGYLIEKGIMFDCSNGKIGLCDPDHSPFWQQCGSCAVVYFELEDLPIKLKDNNCYFTKFQRHREYPNIAAQHDRPLTPYSDYMGVYIVNHGENNVTVYRGKSKVKSDYVRRNEACSDKFLQKIALLHPQLKNMIT